MIERVCVRKFGEMRIGVRVFVYREDRERGAETETETETERARRKQEQEQERGTPGIRWKRHLLVNGMAGTMRVRNSRIRVDILCRISFSAREKRHASTKPHHDFLQHDDIVHAHSQ